MNSGDFTPPSYALNLNASEGEPTPPDDAWMLLKDRFTEVRRQRMESVVRQRTAALRLVVQDIHNPHNVSACLRSAEAFGIQQVDVVCLKEKFSPSTVARGVAHWLTIRKWESIAECARQIKSDGYRLAAALPSPQATPLEKIEMTGKPLAVVFGNEHDGVHSAWQEFVDFSFTIPMAGFVESLNISVSAALTLHHLTQTAKAQLPAQQYLLPPESQQQLLSKWACNHLRDWQKELKKVRSAATLDAGSGTDPDQ